MARRAEPDSGEEPLSSAVESSFRNEEALIEPARFPLIANRLLQDQRASEGGGTRDASAGLRHKQEARQMLQ